MIIAEDIGVVRELTLRIDLSRATSIATVSDNMEHW